MGLDFPTGTVWQVFQLHQWLVISLPHCQSTKAREEVRIYHRTHLWFLPISDFWSLTNSLVLQWQMNTHLIIAVISSPAISFQQTPAGHNYFLLVKIFKTVYLSGTPEFSAEGRIWHWSQSHSIQRTFNVVLARWKEPGTHRELYTMTYEVVRVSDKKKKQSVPLPHPHPHSNKKKSKLK